MVHYFIIFSAFAFHTARLPPAVPPFIPNVLESAKYLNHQQQTIICCYYTQCAYRQLCVGWVDWQSKLLLYCCAVIMINIIISGRTTPPHGSSSILPAHEDHNKQRKRGEEFDKEFFADWEHFIRDAISQAMQHKY